MSKTVNELVIYRGGAQLPNQPSAASLATDSAGNIVAGSAASAGVPTLVGSAATFTVPAATQLPWHADIDNQGTIRVLGTLCEV